MEFPAMLTPLQLRENAWAKLAASKTLLDAKQWDEARYLCGYAVEFILKARICVDQKLTGFPETRAEADALLPLRVWEHEFGKLLNLTSLATLIKVSHMNDWSVCLEWKVDTRYHPKGSVKEQPAREMLRAAESIVRVINDNPGMEAAVVATTDNPYVKLWAMHQELMIERGKFALYGLWHRIDSHEGSADLVVSAPWINADTREGVQHVIDAMNRMLTPQDLQKVAGVIALDMEHPVVQFVTRMIEVHSARESFFTLSNLAGVQVDSAMIVTARRDVP